MKSYLLAAILLMLVFNDLFGKIRNGYERDLEKARLSIQHIRQLLADNPQYSSAHKRKLNATISKLTDLLVYHQLTDTLLQKFRTVAPDLYGTIDTLKDHRGRDVEVYVRFVPKEKARVESSGFITFSIPDKGDFCVSEYGEGTVSVTIWIVSNSLVVLSHEFGHLQYIVPNLAKYLSYYRRAYHRSHSGTALGHDCGDASGMNALRFEHRYRTHYRRYIKGDASRKILPFAFINPMRRRIEAESAFGNREVARVTY